MKRVYEDVTRRHGDTEAQRVALRATTKAGIAAGRQERPRGPVIVPPHASMAAAILGPCDALHRRRFSRPSPTDTAG
ncbi:MAG: hypothetical protein IKO40_09670 [Kiritimatiellae bacterium]|nr:hypothetical protein [Kiritimatiellia bacterium]